MCLFGIWIMVASSNCSREYVLVGTSTKLLIVLLYINCLFESFDLKNQLNIEFYVSWLELIHNSGPSEIN